MNDSFRKTVISTATSGGTTGYRKTSNVPNKKGKRGLSKKKKFTNQQYAPFSNGLYTGY
jgi:hypothetical protein